MPSDHTEVSHLLRRPGRLAAFNMPFLLHVDTMVDRIPLVIRIASCAFAIFSTPKRRIRQVTLIIIRVGARRRGPVELVFEQALMGIRAFAADVGVAGDQAGPYGGQG